MGKNICRIVPVLILLCAVSWTHAVAETLPIGVSATILSSIGLTEVQPLDFGSVMVGSGAGSLTIDPSMAINATGGVVSSGTPTPAMVAITAEPGLQLVMMTDSSVTLQSGSNTMTVDNFTINDSVTGTKSMALATGTGDALIGATLQIGANQPPGIYTGTFNYTVNYQ